jgi:hypothetical protein
MTLIRVSVTRGVTDSKFNRQRSGSSVHRPLLEGAVWSSGCHAPVHVSVSPQADEQSEATNKIVAMYLRCLTGDRPRQWLQWMSWAEFCYNSSFQTSLRTTPFRVVYGWDPPSLRSYSLGEAMLPAVDAQLRERDEFLQEVMDRLEQAQQHHKDCYDRKHRQLEFQVGQ